MHFYYGETQLDAAMIAEITGLTTDRIEGIFGPGTIGTVSIDGDQDAMSPDQWDLGDDRWAVIHPSNEYKFKDSIGISVPEGILRAIREHIALERGYYRYHGTDHALRVVQRYAALFGYVVELRTLSGYNESDELLIVVPKEDSQVIEGIYNEWQTYFAQEVYVATVEVEGPLSEHIDDVCGGLYGDEAVEDFVKEAITYGVQAIIGEIRSERAA